MRKATSLASALAVLAIATALQSCDWRTPSATGDTAADSAATAAFCTAEFSDSVAINNATAYAEIKADFPAEEDSSVAAQAVLEWLCREVRGRCYPDYVGESVDSAFSLTTNEGTFAENVVNTYGRKGLDNMANDLREMAIDGYEGFMGNYLTIELVENTPDYLTSSTMCTRAEPTADSTTTGRRSARPTARPSPGHTSTRQSARSSLS